jgi:imidazolonepropionase-like amidohydrolase
MPETATAEGYTRRSMKSRPYAGPNFGSGALAVALLLVATSAFAQVTAIRAGHLVDPATGTVARNQVILVEGGRIVDVGPQVTVPAGASVIDLSGKWVLPGLMDAHTHLTLGTVDYIGSYIRQSKALRALLGARSAQDVVRAGFTVVKDIGNDGDYAGVDVRRAVERGWFVGPTFLNAGKIIAPYGGQSRNVPPEQGAHWQFEYIDADTPDEVRKAIRQNIYYGATTIKLVSDSHAYFYSVDEIKAAVAEAHAAGMTVAVHATRDEPARNAILGGAESIEHGFQLSDAVLTLMKEKGTVLVGTDFPAEHLQAMNSGVGAGRDPKAAGEAIIDRLRRAYRIGVPMAFGTDVVMDIPGRTRADMMLDYLAVWRAAGIPHAAILKAMTTDTAALFKMTDTRGAIRKGLAADIIATPADPLLDIQALRKVEFVMKAGTVIRGSTTSPDSTR